MESEYFPLWSVGRKRERWVSWRKPKAGKFPGAERWQQQNLFPEAREFLEKYLRVFPVGSLDDLADGLVRPVGD